MSCARKNLLLRYTQGRLGVQPDWTLIFADSRGIISKKEKPGFSEKPGFWHGSLSVEFLEQVGALAERDFGDAPDLFHVSIQRFDRRVAIGGGFDGVADGRVLIGVGFGVGVERFQGFGDGAGRVAVDCQDGGIGFGLRGLIGGAGGGDHFLFVERDSAGDFERGAIAGGEVGDGADGVAEVDVHFARGSRAAGEPGGGVALGGQHGLALGEGGLRGFLESAAVGEFGGIVAALGQQLRDFGIGFDDFKVLGRRCDLFGDDLILLGVAFDGLRGGNDWVRHDAPCRWNETSPAVLRFTGC